MESKRTKATPKPGEVKQPSNELVRKMVTLSNNSRLTMDVAKMLTNSLDKQELAEFNEWLKHANHQISYKISNAKKFQ
jgi:hypothetical protein